MTTTFNIQLLTIIAVNKVFYIENRILKLSSDRAVIKF